MIRRSISLINVAPGGSFQQMVTRRGRLVSASTENEEYSPLGSVIYFMRGKTNPFMSQVVDKVRPQCIIIKQTFINRL